MDILWPPRAASRPSSGRQGMLPLAAGVEDVSDGGLRYRRHRLLCRRVDGAFVLRQWAVPAFERERWQPLSAEQARLVFAALGQKFGEMDRRAANAGDPLDWTFEAGLARLSGDLGTTSLAQLFGEVQRRRWSATVVVSLDPFDVHFLFRQGRLMAARSTDPRRRLGAYLSAAGALDPEQLDSLLRRRHAEAAVAPLGQFAVGSGGAGPEAVRRAIRAQFDDCLVDVLLARRAPFEVVRRGTEPLAIPLDVELEWELLGAARRADEWLARCLRERPLRLAARADGEQLGHAVGEDWPLFEALLDGAASLAEIAAATDIPEADILPGLLRLYADGVVDVDVTRLPRAGGDGEP